MNIEKERRKAYESSLLNKSEYLSTFKCKYEPLCGANEKKKIVF